jgi:hypothetical protein
MADKTPIFKWIWDVCPAKNGDKLVLLCLACFADPEKDGECWVAPEMLEAKTGMTRRNIYRCMQRLVANGWLILGAERKVEHGRTLCRRYRIPYSSDNLSDLSSDNLSSSSDNLSVSLDNLSSSCDKLYTDNKDKEHKEKKNTGADAPAPAASQPSLPSSSAVAVPPPRQSRAPKSKPAAADLSSLALPHGAGFHKWWLHFIEHRAGPIKGRRNPLTLRAAEIILGELSAVNEQQAVESIKKCIASGWVKPYQPDTPKDTAKVLRIPRSGPVQPSEAEKRMMALEALQEERMRGVA